MRKFEIVFPKVRISSLQISSLRYKHRQNFSDCVRTKLNNKETMKPKPNRSLILPWTPQREKASGSHLLPKKTRNFPLMLFILRPHFLTLSFHESTKMADFIPQGVRETRTQALENVRFSSLLSSKSLREND